jgi:hypothetical protein
VAKICKDLEFAFSIVPKRLFNWQA